MNLQRNKTLSAIAKNSKRYLVALSLIALISMFVPSTLNQKATNANAQAVSTVPSNMLQYEWLGPQDNFNTHFSSGPAPNSPDVLWQLSLPTNTGNPVAFNGMVLVTQGPNIIAFDPETGNMVYNVTIPPVISGRANSAGYIMKVDATHMLAWSTTASVPTANPPLPAAYAFRCFNIADGSLVWSVAIPQFGPSIYRVFYAADLKMVYVVTGNQTGRGGTQNDGVLQAWQLPDPTKPPTLAWTYVAFGPISGTTAVIYGDGKLFVGSSEPFQACLDAATGKVLWNVPLTGAPVYAASYSNGVLYRGLLSNDFVAINGSTGATLWNFNPHDYGFWCSGTAAGYGMVYELNVDGYIYALNATTGNVVWKYLGPGQSYPGYVEVADGKVYACTGQATYSPLVGYGASEYSCFNAYTGQVIWQINKEFGSGPTDNTAIAYGNFYGVDPETSTGVSVDSNIAGVNAPATKYLLICYGSTPQDWTMFGGNPAHTATGYGGPVNMIQEWSFHTGGAVISSPAVVAGMVYVGSDDKNLYCLNASTGTKVWSFTTGYQIRSTPAVVNGKVYTGADDGNVYCLNANTGSQLWKTPAPGSVLPITINTYPQFFSSPTVVGGLVYLGAPDGKLYCLDANTGTVDWTIQTTGAICSTPAYIAGDGLYFTSVDGFVYKVNAATGSVIWNASTPIGLEDCMEGSACVGNGMVVVGSGAAHNAPANYGQMYCLNATTGKSIWTYTELIQSGNLQATWTALYLNSPSFGPVFFFNDFFDLDCVNATNGKLIWQSYLTRESFTVPAYADGKIYTGRMTFGIYVSNATDGTKMGYFDAGAEVASSPAIYENKVYFGCYNWNVYCVGQASSGTTYYGSQTPKPSVATPDTSPAPAPLVISAASNAMNPTPSESTGNQVPLLNYLIISNVAIAIAVIVLAASVLRTRRKK